MTIQQACELQRQELIRIKAENIKLKERIAELESHLQDEPPAQYGIKVEGDDVE